MQRGMHVMSDFAPGMRIIVRDEEWMVKKVENNEIGNKVLYCIGISPLHFVQHLSLKGKASAALRFNYFINYNLARNMALLLRRAVSEAD